MPEQTAVAESDPGAASPDGKTIPIERLNAQIDKTRKLETEVAELRGQVQGLAARPAAEAPKAVEPREYSRAEIKAAVIAGQITEEAGDALWDAQQERKTAKIAANTAANLVGTNQHETTVSAEIAKYAAAMPDILDPNSDGHKAVVAEFRSLVAAGLPAERSKGGLATELAALKAVFGPATKLAKAGKRESETHEETGSGAGEPGKVEVRDGKPKGLTAREKDYYGKFVGPGKMYKDWAAVTTMIEKRGDPELRRRMGARHG